MCKGLLLLPLTNDEMSKEFGGNLTLTLGGGGMGTPVSINNHVYMYCKHDFIRRSTDT